MDWFGIPLGLVFLVGIILMVAIYRNMERRQSEAHDKVIELRRKGIKAKVCPKCKGKGKNWSGDFTCKKCDGLGYLYELPEVKEGTERES